MHAVHRDGASARTRNGASALSTKKRFSYEACHLTSSLSTHAAAHLTISIKTVSQSVELSFNSSIFDNPFSLRTIKLARGFAYNLVCTRRDGQFDGNSWFSGNGAAISIDTSQRTYAQSPNSYTWILVFTNFEFSDIGKYSCSDSGEMLSLVTLAGKWLGVGSGNKMCMLDAKV